MSEIAKLLRLSAPSDKEIASQKVNILAVISGELLSSALTEENSRKRMYLYNSSNASSGELYIGPEGVTPLTGMVVPKAVWVELSCSSDLDIYIVAGGTGTELRILELS